MTCGGCGLVRVHGDMPFERRLVGKRRKMLCESCRKEWAQERRKATAVSVLSRGHDGGTVTRDGQEFKLTVLPPKRRGGHR